MGVDWIDVVEPPPYPQVVVADDLCPRAWRGFAPTRPLFKSQSNSKRIQHPLRVQGARCERGCPRGTPQANAGKEKGLQYDRRHVEFQGARGRENPIVNQDTKKRVNGETML